VTGRLRRARSLGHQATDLHCRVRMGNLLWVIIVVLVILWLLGFVAFPVGGNLIHILLVIALVLVVYRLATGRRVL
jgi:hypothetical protein